jgi:hypothetical protein
VRAVSIDALERSFIDREPKLGVVPAKQAV